MLKSLIQLGYDLWPEKEWPAIDGGVLDRREYVSASEVGKCLRQTWFKKRATSVKPQNWGYMERGNNVEDWAVDKIHFALQGTGGKLLYAGQDQLSFYYGNMSGTPDGLLRFSGGTADVVEFKSIDPRKNKNFLPQPEHVDQVAQNIYLMNEWQTYHVKSGWLIYINASNYMDMTEFKIEPTEADFDRLQKRADLIMSAESEHELDPEGMRQYNGCSYCDFKDSCSAAVEAAQAENENVIETLQKAKGLSDDFFK